MARSSAIVRNMAQGMGSLLVLLLFCAPFALLLLALHHLLGRAQLTAAAAYTFLVVAWVSRDMVSKLKRRRRLRQHGVSADATIVDRHETYAAIPGGYNGWTTTVTVAFTDASGTSIRTAYPFYHTRASKFTDGATLRVRYDPLQPTQISVGKEDSLGTEAYLLTLPGLVAMLGLAIYFAYRAVS